MKPSIQPGDFLLYSGKGFFSWLIKVKTWSRFSHVEVYIGHGQTIASRDGIGVDIYWTRDKDLACVLRPNKKLDIDAGIAWAQENCILGQKYDWWGLLRFFTFGKPSMDKQFCSELATRFARASGFHPFNDKYDADTVSPGMFYSSPNLDVVWEDTDEVTNG